MKCMQTSQTSETSGKTQSHLLMQIHICELDWDWTELVWVRSYLKRSFSVPKPVPSLPSPDH